MKKSFQYTCAAATAVVAFSLSACGDEVTEITEVHQDGAAVLVAGESLDSETCDVSQAGKTVYVMDSSAAFICDGEDWQTLNGEDGVDGKNGEDGEKGAKGDRGAKGESGEDGEDGEDGASCTAKKLDATKDHKNGGFKITCGDDSFDVWNGEDGVNGEDGKDGKSAYELSGSKKSLEDWIESLNGEDGTNGSGCTSTDDGKGSVTITCGSGDDAVNTTLYKAMCGVAPYDPAKKFCSEAKLFDLCGGKAFDTKTQYCEENKVFGKLTDSRDNKVYKTVQIGDQVWMAENLNVSVKPGEQSWCGGGKEGEKVEGDCSVYGRLYTWAAAVGKTEDECGIGHKCSGLEAPVQGVCPTGWHLPSVTEFELLIETVGGSIAAGTPLKSKTGWREDDETPVGTDVYGFSVIPAGDRNELEIFHNVGENAEFWSASEIDDDVADFMAFSWSYTGVEIGKLDKYYAFSVRCVKD